LLISEHALENGHTVQVWQCVQQKHIWRGREGLGHGGLPVVGDLNFPSMRFKRRPIQVAERGIALGNQNSTGDGLLTDPPVRARASFSRPIGIRVVSSQIQPQISIIAFLTA
jgi:hypothetical protein